jgi:hypothetical protein
VHPDVEPQRDERRDDVGDGGRDSQPEQK